MRLYALQTPYPVSITKPQAHSPYIEDRNC